MTLLNPRDIQNKSGTTFTPGSLTVIYAEDYNVFKVALEDSGSEIFPWVYNVSSVERDALTTYGSGHVVYNTTVGSLQVYSSGSWQDIGGGGGGQSYLGSLLDVVITSVAGSELLTYDLTLGSWKNQTLAEAGVSAVGHSHTASDISDFDTEVQNNGSVALNTTHRGLTNNPHGVTASQLSDFSEAVDDRVASLITNGNGLVSKIGDRACERM